MNDFVIYDPVGKGRNSVVYKGRRKQTLEYCAVKSVEKAQKARILWEVRLWHTLEHRNVLRFHAWYETKNHLWLILEYCVGGNLLTLLRQDARLPEASIHDIARDLVLSLQYLHSRAIVFCDLKPANVLLDENGRSKLDGFGLAQRLADLEEQQAAREPPARPPFP